MANLPTSPAISVVISVYNGLPYLERAVRSVMEQTFTDIEIIVVDDASIDDTPEVLSRLAAEDGRIRLHSMPENSGIAAALNAGIGLARGALIARMDSDDLAHPTRLERQKTAMDAEPDLIVLGTSLRQIDTTGAHIHTSRRPRDDFIVRWMSMFHMPFNHPTIMLRASETTKPYLRYKSEFEPAEDFDLVERLLHHGGVRNMGDVLLDYRVHANQISSVRYRRQIETIAGIARRHQANVLPDDIRERLAPFNAAFLDFTPIPAADIFSAMRQLIAYDAARHSAYRQFLRRYGAQLVTTALLRIKTPRRAIPLMFLKYGRDFLLPLGLRFLETKCPRI